MALAVKLTHNIRTIQLLVSSAVTLVFQVGIIVRTPYREFEVIQTGLEVETNCTITQNIKCKCMPGFFCDSQPCQHCNPCDKKCTLVALGASTPFCHSGCCDGIFYMEENFNIDLTHYISDIAEEMKLEEVIKLVRKLGTSPTRIDEVMHNNNNNVSEQKIKLLECWYQEKGKKGAYETLITTLKKLRFRAIMDKIEQKNEAWLNQSQ
ncbi:hypothetical protein JD844_006512 [Phrynosoma platyrhinos]|uniref:Death domain-containing protein n=1 Tax=Phrynosoma platyrhinos TaxID=52577 RepID=A0ABQ7T225_PHRPL|nr:hypothetical protein JD844_006512 [Phrynosoma platyrhinos]